MFAADAENKRLCAMKIRATQLILLILTVLLLPAVYRPLRARPLPHDADRSAIAQVLKNQQTAWDQGDVDTFLEGYWHSPELTFSGSGGIARGWDAVRARYKKNYVDRQAMGQLEFSALEFRFLGRDAALVLGHWHLTRTKGDVGGVFSLVWQRFPEGWRIVHDHTSAVDSAK
jgi:beta-aspartyl-peptidase (threonine type)